MISFFDKKKKKGFTLIELLAVIVILAILALIAIPIVISIIKDSRESSGKRSVESFGRATAAAMSNYMTKNDQADYGSLYNEINTWDDFIKKLNIKYSGTKVRCAQFCMSRDGSIAILRCAAGKDAESAISNGNYIKEANGTPFSYVSGEPKDTGTYIDSFSTVNSEYFDSNFQTWTATSVYTAVGTQYLDYSNDGSGTAGFMAKGMQCKYFQ